ncbi:hypothetical protein Kfla_5234 [Kribbella flavida DSM 17836]|uniref:DUF4190 domain-containing protein n=1 Tax=Kribbella flavida (strain DSM 17836 / JCM 10339 / NBRC 14399) TaxID=479435 RepID=D2Q4Z3_KRIFD|nr:hypothetical protein [Kribbella flavida]ADB34248.1 hypothetical protein Kfla_5234 [Kribbella flavida DSM 17836]
MSFGERPQDRPDPSRGQAFPQYGDHAQQGYPQQGGYPQPGPPAYGSYPLQPGFPDQPAYGVLRDNSNATLALVLGLIPLVTGILLISPFAWWKANQALAEIDAAPGVYNNRGMAVGGKICGILGTVLLGLVILMLLFLLVTLVLFADAS